MIPANYGVSIRIDSSELERVKKGFERHKAEAEKNVEVLIEVGRHKREMTFDELERFAAGAEYPNP